MKLIIGFVFFLVISSRLPASAQTSFPHAMDVVVEIKKFNQEKHLAIISQSLDEFSPNSLVKTVCNWSGWILIRIDEDQINGPDALLDILKNAGFEVEFKEGATLADLTIACKEAISIF